MYTDCIVYSLEAAFCYVISSPPFRQGMLIGIDFQILIVLQCRAVGTGGGRHSVTDWDIELISNSNHLSPGVLKITERP